MGKGIVLGRLTIGINDIETMFPTLAEQFHETLNAPRTPKTTAAFSNDKSIWWKHPDCGHEWQQSPALRTRNGKILGCPICSHQRIIPGLNDLATTHPMIIDEWHPDNTKKPTEVSSVSHALIKWICDNHHTWECSVREKIKGQVCPVCSMSKTTEGINDLATTHPELLTVWDWSLNKITPSQIVYETKKIISWRCPKCLLAWKQRPCSLPRSTNNQCPYCNGRKRPTTRTDIEATHPSIASEWDYEKNRDLIPNIELTPAKVSHISSLTVWWTCKRQHSWQAQVRSRTGRKSRCPKCMNEHGTSFPEQALLYYVRANVPCRVISRHKVKTSGKSYEIDVYIPEMKIGIEYDGGYWHAETRVRDETKTRMLARMGINLYRIVESDHDEERDSLISYDVKRNKNENLDQAIRLMLDKLNVPETVRPNVSKDRESIMNQYMFDKETKSLPARYPELSRQWSPRNRCSPDLFRPNSSQTVWWRCELGHEWSAAINQRVNLKTRCPFCSNNRLLPGFNDLETKAPLMALDWDPDLNDGKTASQTTYCSVKDAWWKCHECSFIWKTSPRYRTRNNAKCPRCNDRVLIPGQNDLRSMHPALAEEWSSNNQQPPEQVHARSSKSFLWNCPNGHEYDLPLRSRVRGAGCPFCGNRRLLTGFNDLATRHPKLAEQWSLRNQISATQIMGARSSKPVWWEDALGHHWAASITERLDGARCPICDLEKSDYEA